MTTLAPWSSIFSLQEYETRIQRARSAARSAGVDYLVAFANKVMPGHVRYLTGYETRHGIHDWTVFAMDVRDGGACTLMTNVSWEALGEMTWVTDTHFTSLAKVGHQIADLIPASARVVGIAGYRSFPAPIYKTMTERLAGVEIHDVSEEIQEVRKRKSPAEINVLRRCAEVTDAGALAFLAGAKEGRSEREILVEVESALKLAGSDEVSFTTQVGSGPATASICPYPTDRRLSQGDIVQLDCGASCLGYRGDISRVAVVGDPPARLRMFMDLTAEMYDTMFAALRPGVVVSDLARIGVEVARARGLYDCLYRSPTHDVGFMGHAIGTGYHEPPEICLEDHSEIHEDMVLVLEPILMEAGLGGVKLEDAVVVTATGAEPLSKSPLRTW